MKTSSRIRTTLAHTLAAALAFGVGGASHAKETPAISSLADGNTTLGVALYKQLGKKEGNLFFSPLSITSALGMTYAGARGDTAEEMRKALAFPAEPGPFAEAFKTYSGELTENAENSDQTLKIANAVCLTTGSVSDEFLELLKTDFQATAFSGGLPKINGWVKEKTEGKITKILDKLSPNSVCVLLNAVYFKGTWEKQFDKDRTRKEAFHLASGEPVKVPMMRQKTAFRMIGKPGFQAICLPYKGNALSMVVLLPRKPEGLADLERSLSNRKLSLWLKELDGTKPKDVEVILPKFKLESGYDLVAPCQEMGMKLAFQPGKANFEGMGWKKGDLWISQIKHKAFVEVNEQGTEAAASTAVEMQTRSILRHPVFRADHPFLFLIRDNKTRTILFIGRLANPKE